MGCFSGRLMSAASDQKLFCKLCSPFCCSFNEFAEEKVISPSYSSAILTLCHSFVIFDSIVSLEGIQFYNLLLLFCFWLRFLLFCFSMSTTFYLHGRVTIHIAIKMKSGWIIFTLHSFVYFYCHNIHHTIFFLFCPDTASQNHILHRLPYFSKCQLHPSMCLRPKT